MSERECDVSTPIIGISFLYCSRYKDGRVHPDFISIIIPNQNPIYQSSFKMRSFITAFLISNCKFQVHCYIYSTQNCPLTSLPLVALLAVAQGTQFITGPCASDADCASGCCGFNSGKCAGPVVAQERDGGCGFGGAQSNADAAGTQGAPAANATAGNTGATAGAGSQFITGECSSDADCASGCCGFNSGKCAGPVVAQERDGGCGFGDAQPNANAVQAARF